VTPRQLDRHVRRGGAQGERHGAYTWRAEDWHSKAREREPVRPRDQSEMPAQKARQLQKLQKYERHRPSQSRGQPAYATVSSNHETGEREAVVK
jgi:hypothetical protein